MFYALGLVGPNSVLSPVFHNITKLSGPLAGGSNAGVLLQLGGEMRLGARTQTSRGFARGSADPGARSPGPRRAEPAAATWGLRPRLRATPPALGFSYLLM